MQSSMEVLGLPNSGSFCYKIELQAAELHVTFPRPLVRKVLNKK